MQNAFEAALHSAAVTAPQATGWLRVTGEDRVRWLNGMVTNSISGLTPGEGCYNFVLNAQGRIQADCTAWLSKDDLLLQTADPAALLTLLDRYIIMDDVELEVLEPPYQPVSQHLVGPGAPALLEHLGLPVPEPMHRLAASGMVVQHGQSPLVPRFELCAAATQNLPALDLPTLDPEDLQALRLLEGAPVVGIDIRERDLPQETVPEGGSSPALHFSKGCYLGQEIVERIRSRGQVHRLLAGFALDGALPGGNAVLMLEDKPVGELTSSAHIPLGTPVQLGLGIVRREALESAARGVPLLYTGGVARPVPLPYRAALG